VKRFLTLGLVLPGIILAQTAPALAQNSAACASASVSSPDGAIAQMHEYVRSLKIEQASLEGTHAIHNHTGYQNSSPVTEARLQNQIDGLLIQIAQLRSVDEHRAEKNLHMLNELSDD
jgi:hypothetical protein